MAGIIQYPQAVQRGKEYTIVYTIRFYEASPFVFPAEYYYAYLIVGNNNSFKLLWTEAEIATAFANGTYNLQIGFGAGTEGDYCTVVSVPQPYTINFRVKDSAPDDLNFFFLWRSGTGGIT